MKNKNILALILGLFVLVIVFFVFLDNDKREKINEKDLATLKSDLYSSAILVVSENKYDFGVISMKDGVVSHKFKIKNTGEEPVKIGRVYTSCACTTALISDSFGEKYGKFGMPGHKGFRINANAVVGSGEFLTVEVVYDPAFHGPAGVGLAQRSIYIESNSIKTPKLELKIQATVNR